MSVAIENLQTRPERRWTVPHDVHQQEAVSGHLVMLTSLGEKRHNLPVLGRIYNCTTSGRMLCLWPDKLHCPSPLGCINLRDTSVTCHDSTHIFTLRHQRADDLPLLVTLACPSAEEYQCWKRVLQSSARFAVGGRRKYTLSSFVTRLPMLIEEDAP